MQDYFLKALELCPNETSVLGFDVAAGSDRERDADSVANSLLILCKPLVKLTKAFQVDPVSAAEALSVLQFIADYVPRGSESLLEQGEP